MTASPPIAPSGPRAPILAAALACSWVAASSVADLVHGGLLPVAISAVSAAFLAIPLARLEREDTGPGDRLTDALRSAGRSWAFVLIGGAVAPVAVHEEGLLVLLCGALLLWAARARAERVAIVLLGASLLTLAVSVALAGDLPIGLLEPHPETWRKWLPGAIARGIIASGAGSGLWRGSGGRYRAPWLAVGIASTAMLLRALRLGGGWELGIEGDPWLLVSTATLGLAGAAALVATSDRPGITVAGISASFLCFGGPAAAAAATVWPALVPLPAALLAFDAARRDLRRLPASLAALGMVIAVWWAWPGAPRATVAAAALAAMVVVITWIAGFAAARRPEAA